MRRLRAIDLWRHDGVGDIGIIVAQILINLHRSFSELLVAVLREDFGRRRIAGKKTRDMIWRPAHKAEAFLGPALNGAPAADAGRQSNLAIARCG